MYTLTDEQIDFILNDIRHNGIETEDLQLNLLDHICCMLEQEMNGAADFEPCYQRVIRQFYKRDLSEIEQETQRLLAFKNYYAMKKLMIIAGALSGTAFIAGSFFKIMYWPGASLFLVVGVLLFSFFFLPLLVLLKTKEADSFRNKLILVLGALVAILYSMSTLFAVMRWPGATPLWISTVATSIFVLVPTYFFTGIRKPETKVNTIVTTLLMICATGLLFTLLRVRQPMPLQSYSYVKNEQLLRKMLHNKDAQAAIAGDTLASAITGTCNTLKGIILDKDIARTSLPDDADEQNIIINERGVYIPVTSKAYQLLAKLRTDVAAYNAAQPVKENKIPVTHTILDIGEKELNSCSNLYVLNSLTQLQLSLATNIQHTAYTMK